VILWSPRMCRWVVKVLSKAADINQTCHTYWSFKGTHQLRDIKLDHKILKININLLKNIEITRCYR